MTPVTIPAAMARCPTTRQLPCMRAHSCAHALASPVGRMVQDYSIEARDVFGQCANYIPAEMYRTVAAGPAPRVHEAPEGLRL